MKKILFIAKVNKIIEELNDALEKSFRVQFCSYNKPTIMGMMSISKPDLILISMIGAIGLDVSVFAALHEQYEDTPVLTIGDEGEIRRIQAYLALPQFENILRPVTNREVIMAVAKKLGESVAEESAAESGAPAAAGAVVLPPEPVVEDTRRQILVVDDNAGMLRSIKTMLDDTYQISVAPSGVKAMAMLGKTRPDLILLDYEMPVVDGRQTLEMIRGEAEFSDIPVIFLTGVNDREHIQSVIALKPAGYMLKPPVKEKLVEVIEKALG